MSDVERQTGTPESAMLMSEIGDLIFKHANMVGIDIDPDNEWGIDDVSALDYVVLAGMVAGQDGKFCDEIEVWQTADKNEGPIVNIIFGGGEEDYRLSKSGVVNHRSGKGLSDHKIGTIRFWLAQTAWSKSRSQMAAEGRT